MNDDSRRLNGLRELADELARWVRACRDEDSDVYDIDLADALEVMLSTIREAIEGP